MNCDHLAGLSLARLLYSQVLILGCINDGQKHGVEQEVVAYFISHRTPQNDPILETSDTFCLGRLFST